MHVVMGYLDETLHGITVWTDRGEVEVTRDGTSMTLSQID